jgi:hypothetical protein
MHMSTTETQVTKVTNVRRSRRVYLSMPVVVYKDGPGPNRPSEETCTLTVNAHGALILLRMPVEQGQRLMLQNGKTQQELACRVVNLGRSQEGKIEVGVEFERPAQNFWHIAFPPEDWSPRSPEAKSATAPKMPRRSPTNA